MFPYEPDYSISLGTFLEGTLEEFEMTSEQLAERCSKPLPTIENLLNNKTKLSTELATCFEQVFGIGANIWLKIDK